MIDSKISVILKTQCDLTAKDGNFGIVALLKNETIPIDNLALQVSVDRLEKPPELMYPLLDIHNACIYSYIDYIAMINLFPLQYLTLPAGVLSDFKYYYNKLRDTQDKILNRDYKRYWIEVISNTINSINLAPSGIHSPLSAELNNNARQTIYTSLDQLLAHVNPPK